MVKTWAFLGRIIFLMELPQVYDQGQFLGGSDGKQSTCNAGDLGLIPVSGRSPGGGNGHPFWRRKWQSTPVLLPRKSHGQRSLVGYSPWGRKELEKGSYLVHRHSYYRLKKKMS